MVCPMFGNKSEFLERIVIQTVLLKLDGLISAFRSSGWWTRQLALVCTSKVKLPKLAVDLIDLPV